MKKIDLVKLVNKVIQEEKTTLNEGKICSCLDGRTLTMGPKPNGVGPYDCNSLRTNNSCSGCCNGGTELRTADAGKTVDASGKATAIKGRNTSMKNASEPILQKAANVDVDGGEINVDGLMEENKNNLTNNKMAKQNLNERLQELAGIKPLYEEEEKEETTKEYSYEEMKSMMMDDDGKMMNESLFAAIGGLVGVLGAAGVTSAIEMALEDPAIAEKYPKLAKVFEFLSKVGGAVGKGIK